MALTQANSESAVTPLGPVRQIHAGALDVGYVDAGRADGPAVLLLHGWPYDIHSYAEVTPRLAGAGYRVIVPYLRGYGTTRFLSEGAVRNGEQAVLALDAVALIDALGIETAIVAGFDWGARTADIVAALWPERVRGLVSVSGYLIGSQTAGKVPLPPEAELQWWYQYYFATERGRAGYDKYRREFAKLIWRTASPNWNFDAGTFDRTAASFDNPDHVAIVTHNYRWRLGLAEGEPEYVDLEKRLADAPVITVPTITSRAMRTARPIRNQAPTPRSSRARIRTGRSRGASGTTSPKKPRKRLLRPSSTSTTPRADRPRGDGMTTAVIGATGRVGSEVVRGALARGDAVAALVRDPDKARRAFGGPDGLHIRPTRLDDSRDLTEALAGIRRVFIAMGSIGLEGALQRIAINAAARIPSIEQVTRLSVLNTSPDSLGINQRAHYGIDQFACSTAVPYSTIRPAIFSASLLAAASEVRASRTWTGLADSGRVALIDHRDAAEAGLRVLSDPVLWGAHHDLTGPIPMSWPEALELLSAKLGEPVTFRVAAEREILERLTGAGVAAGEAELLIAREWAILAGENDYTTDTFQQMTGRPPRAVAEFLHEHRAQFV